MERLTTYNPCALHTTFYYSGALDTGEQGGTTMLSGEVNGVDSVQVTVVMGHRVVVMGHLVKRKVCAAHCS